MAASGIDTEVVVLFPDCQSRGFRFGNLSWRETEKETCEISENSGEPAGESWCYGNASYVTKRN
jgi:hypothetical protein